MWVAIWWQWVCGCSDFLSQIGFKFWFYFEFLLWVSEFDHGFFFFNLNFWVCVLVVLVQNTLRS